MGGGMCVRAIVEVADHKWGRRPEDAAPFVVLPYAFLMGLRNCCNVICLIFPQIQLKALAKQVGNLCKCVGYSVCIEIAV